MKLFFIAGLLSAMLTSSAAIDTDPSPTPPKLTLHNPPTVTTGANQVIVPPLNSTLLTSTNTVEGSIVTTRWSRFKVPGQSLKKVVVLGSSTSVGTGATATEFSYVGRLRNYYTAQGIALSFTNLANSGTNLGAALPTGTVPMTGFSNPDPNSNVTRAISLGANVVIINFPSNAYDNAAVTPEVVAETHQIIYNALQAAGIQCYITTTQPRHDFSMANRIKLQVIRDTLLQRFGDHCINFYDGVTIPGTTTQIPEYAAGDGIHLNNLGYERLYQLVRAANIFEHTFNAGCSIATPSSANTNVNGLYTGTHLFQVSVIDADGLAASAVTQVIVTPGVLPLKLLSFSGNRSGNNHHLQWETSNETGSSHFEVESSNDGISYVKTGTVPAQNNVLSRYVFTRQQQQSSVVYYRLKMFDLDGRFVYSPVIKIVGGQLKLSVALMPNPVLSDANLLIDVNRKGSYRIMVSDISGRAIYNQEVVLQDGQTVLTVPVAGQPKGTYMVRVTGRGEEVMARFIK